jgi:hypothetical protein
MSKKYTRRTTRDRLIDLLEEAIRLVKVRCVGPEEDVLQTARREFQEAADMKNQAAALLKTAREAEPEAEAEAEAPLTTNGFAQIPEVLPQVPATPQASLAAQFSRPANLSITRKKLPSCPGGPKAFNEFLKSKRAEVEANLGPNAKYADVRAEISKRWKETCRKTNTKKLSKVKTLATPGRVNAPATLLEAVPAPAESAAEESTVEESVAAEPASEPAAEPASEPASEPAAEPASEPAAEPASEPASEGLTPVEAYEDEGLDDTLGMRRIVVEGRPLYMTNSNKGLFDRSNDEVGSFVGYLRNGKIVEQDAPNDV